MRKVIKFVVTIIWQLSRVCAAVIISFWVALLLILIFDSVDGPKMPRVKPEPNVCGKIAGRVFEFSREYVMFWPEYEGKSSWEPGFINNKKGCDANFRSLSMAMSWPEMKPVSLMEAQSSGFSGVILTIKPASHEFSDMRWLLEFYLRNSSLEQMASAKYLVPLGLYHLRGASHVFKDEEIGYYWDERGGKVNYVIECPWLKHRPGYFSCTLNFLLPEFLADVEIIFPSGDVSAWREVVSSSVGFIEKGLKSRGE